MTSIRPAPLGVIVPTGKPQLSAHVARIVRGRPRRSGAGATGHTLGDLQEAWAEAAPEERSQHFDALFRWANDSRSHSSPDRAAVGQFLAYRAPELMAGLTAVLASQPSPAQAQAATALLARLRAAYGGASGASPAGPAPDAGRPAAGAAPAQAAPTLQAGLLGRRIGARFRGAAPRTPGGLNGARLRGPRPMPAPAAAAAAAPAKVASEAEAMANLLSGSRVRLTPALVTGSLERLGGDPEPLRRAWAWQKLCDGLYRDQVPGNATAAVHQFLKARATGQLQDIEGEYAKLGPLGARRVLHNFDTTLQRLAGSNFAGPQVRSQATALIERLQQAASAASASIRPEVPPTSSSRAQTATEVVDTPDVLSAAHWANNPTLATLRAELPIAQTSKRTLGTVNVRLSNNRVKRVNVSTLTRLGAGAPAVYMAATTGAGAFSKFRPALYMVNGQPRRMGARMVRTAEQVGRPGPKMDEVGTWREGRRQHRTTSGNYLSERAALDAVHSRYAPVASLVDEKGRLYDLVEMADGDVDGLMHVLGAPARGALLAPLLADLLAELSTLDGAGYAHRDIKPANVMWNRDGSFSLADFGLAQRQGEARDRRGTPGFISPEVYTGDAAEAHAIDMYAVGMTMVAAMTQGGSLHNFPLAFSPPTRDLPAQAHEAATQTQIAQIVRNYADWRAFHDRGGQPANAQVRAVDRAYRQMHAYSPVVADMVFMQLLNPYPGVRGRATDRRAQLLAALGPAGPSRAAATAITAQAARQSPINVEIERTLDVLRDVQANDSNR